MANTILCLNGDCLTVHPANYKFCPKCTHRLLLRQRYQPIRLIGQGGFGRTFLAKDMGKPSQSYCVIKQFFPAAQGTDNIEKSSKLFEEEAKRLEVLGKNPQIPQLLDYFVTDKSQQYLVQEYIDGENLQQELTSRGEVYQEAEVRKILIDVLNILKFVHENNVIHRDIKPENLIRRNSDQKLVLVDFGAAKYIHSQTALGVTGTVIGSAQYCASEQARGKAVFASDLYSLGVVCIHLLTLVEPFQLFDSSENDWVWRDYLGNNQVSDQFTEVLDQLIAVGLKKRFANVDQVLKSLNDQPKKISVSARIPNAVKPTEKYISAKTSKPDKINNNRTSNAVTSAKISIFANDEKVEKFFNEKISFIGKQINLAKLTNNKISNSALSNKISISNPYEKLEKYLANGEWKAADNETSKLILKLVGVENLTLEFMVGETQGWLNDELIEKIPYSDLYEIDRLWLTYSDGRFGFSVQKNIWLNECGGQIYKYDYKTLEKLGDVVGWRKDDKWDIEGVNFTISAPPGHLPLVRLIPAIMVPLFPYISDWFLFPMFPPEGSKFVSKLRVRTRNLMIFFIIILAIPILILGLIVWLLPVPELILIFLIMLLPFFLLIYSVRLLTVGWPLSLSKNFLSYLTRCYDH